MIIPQIPPETQANPLPDAKTLKSEARFLAITPTLSNLSRIRKAFALVDSGAVTYRRTIGANRIYSVKSQSNLKFYPVISNDDISCKCPDTLHRVGHCKHEIAVLMEEERSRDTDQGQLLDLADFPY